MPDFLVDEDLPRSLTRELRAAGFDAQDVRDIGLRGKPDDVVLSSARAANRILQVNHGDGPPPIVGG